MSVYAVENLPRKWYTGDVLINSQKVLESACADIQTLESIGAKYFAPIFVKKEKCVWNYDLSDEAGDYYEI